MRFHRSFVTYVKASATWLMSGILNPCSSSAHDSDQHATGAKIAAKFTPGVILLLALAWLFEKPYENSSAPFCGTF